MDLLSMPVTLIVKAPNQKVADQTIECGYNWTIGKLKRHLSDVYPSKPEEHHQKLIYSGKLLADHLELKDVLRQFEEDSRPHTVHLVCAMSTTDNPDHSPDNHDSHIRPQQATSSSTSENTSPAPVPESTNHTGQSASTDGVRQRHSHSVQSPPTTGNLNPNPYETWQQMYGANMNAFAGGMYGANMGMSAAAMGAYSPEQMMWFQQMYSQQMAQYMQLYQQAAYTVPVPQAAAQNVAPNAAVADQQEANNRAPNARQANNAQVRMNAGAGPMFEEDDDDENFNRDWLDWVYMLSRVAVLLSIVYFYSSFSRFIMVFGFFFLVYVYQQGWFTVRRRRPAEIPQEVQRPQENQPAPEQNAAPAQPHAEGEGPVPEENPNAGDANDEAPVATEPADPPAPNAMTVAWTFVSGFFASLIPQQPVAVNAN